MLHRHLTVAFRALDSKWGKPVDLESHEETSRPCLPVELEKPVTTFSSEEYLKTIRRRPKPYSRPDEVKTRRSKMKDSFSNNSLSNNSLAMFESLSDVGGSISSLESGSSTESIIVELTKIIKDLKRPLDETIEEHEASEKALERKKMKIDETLKQIRSKAFAFVEFKYRNRFK